MCDISPCTVFLQLLMESIGDAFSLVSRIIQVRIFLAKCLSFLEFGCLICLILACRDSQFLQ